MERIVVDPKRGSTAHLVLNDCCMSVQLIFDYAVLEEDYEGCWLYGCRSSVAEHY